MPFNVSGVAKILKVEPVQGTGEDSHVNIKVKLRVEDVPAANITAALGAESAQDVETALFKPKSVDADQNSRFMGIKAIQCEASWEGKHSITFDGFREIRVAKVSGVKIRPRGYCKCDVELQVTIEQPPQGYQEQISEYINRTRRVTLEHDKDLFDGDQPKNDSAPSQQSLPVNAPQRGRPRGSKNKAAKAA